MSWLFSFCIDQPATTN